MISGQKRKSQPQATPLTTPEIHWEIFPLSPETKSSSNKQWVPRLLALKCNSNQNHQRKFPRATFFIVEIVLD